MSELLGNLSTGYAPAERSQSIQRENVRVIPHPDSDMVCGIVVLVGNGPLDGIDIIAS